MLVFVLLQTLAVKAASLVQGYVYQDANRNGLREKTEKAIPDVAVSNGKNVTITDKNGHYQLPLQEDQIIFVIKPAGYRVPLDPNNLPQFYRIHKPAGSPVMKFRGVQPTKPLPHSLDFGLYADQEEDNFSVLLFGDPQPHTKEQMEYFRRGIISEVEGIRHIKFGLSLGDLVGDDLDLNQSYIEAIRKVGIPWYNVIGNHDMNLDVNSDSLSDETFESHFGPSTYSFNYGKVHFIVLDNILYPHPGGSSGYIGGLRRDQLEFVENDLRYVGKEKLVVIAFHIPLLTDVNLFRNEDRQRLFDLLRDYPHRVAISAHTHFQRQNFFTEKDGWKGSKPFHEYNIGTTSGDWYSGVPDAQGIPVATMRDGTPKGYAFIRFEGNQYKIDYKVAGRPADYQMEIFAPKVVPANTGTSAGIYANIFMGHQESQVWYRIDEGEWKKMSVSQDIDPVFLDKLHHWDFSETLLPGYRPSNGIKSTHLWRGVFPVNLPEGLHTIQVRTVDMFNREFIQSRTFRAGI